MKLRVYTCNIPAQYAFGSLETAASLDHEIEVVRTNPGNNRPIDTRDCIQALKSDADGEKADVAAFLWLDEHEQELPGGSFNPRCLFYDPLALVLPKADIYMEFVERNGLSDDGPIGREELIELLTQPKYADHQVVLLRERGSGTRGQICRFLDSDPEETGFLCRTPADCRYTDTVALYRMVLSRASPRPKAGDEPYHIGFVSEKIRVLTEPGRVETPDTMVLEVSGMRPRIFKVANRKDDRPADDVARLMKRLAERRDTELQRARPVKTNAALSGLDKEFEREDLRLQKYAEKRTRQLCWLLVGLAFAVVSGAVWIGVPMIARHWTTVEPAVYVVSSGLQVILLVLYVLGMRYDRFGCLRRRIHRAILSPWRARLDFLRRVVVHDSREER